MEGDQRTLILDNLKDKACLKQKIYRQTLSRFRAMGTYMESLSSDLSKSLSGEDPNVDVSLKNHGEFEKELKFGGDTLLFMMHTNIFTFPPDHFIYKNSYVRQDQSRSYVGMIMVYNFLSDSLKYQRMGDVGYLLGRIFINKDNHFFMQGTRQFSFLFKDFANLEFTDDMIKKVVDTGMLQAIDFELFVPPFETVREISLLSKYQSVGNTALKTGKRVGFHLPEDNN